MEYVDQETWDRLVLLMARRQEPQPGLTLAEKVARLRAINSEIDAIMAQTVEVSP